nr:radical SAM protein [uncultured Anaerosporobacter sp.]
MNYTEMVIMLGNKCTAACDICCINASMECNENIKLNELKNFILSSEKDKNIKLINFSGGEAFLYYNSLIELVKCCKDINKKSTVITNGYWAKDYTSTLIKLSKLKEAGLNTIGVSYDQYHKKFIPIDNIKNISKVVKALDMKFSIQSVLVNEQNDFSWIDDLGENLSDVHLNFIGCDPVGRAKERIQDALYIRNECIHNKICRKSATFCVSYTGDIYPCCSPYIFDSILAVGNIKENINVDEALKRLENNSILKLLRNKGFDFFVNIVDKHNICELPSKVISACELCNIILNKNILKKMMPYILDELEKDSNCVRKTVMKS